MGKYSQKQHCFYLENIKLHQGCTDHEYWRKMLMTWHFILPNLLNIACGSLTEVKSCQRKELLYARFLCKNRFPNTVPYFALWSYIRKPSSAVHSSKAKGNKVKTSGPEEVNLGPAFSSLMWWHWPGDLAPFSCQHKETLAQFPGRRDLRTPLEEGGFKGAQFLEHGFIP